MIKRLKLIKELILHRNYKELQLEIEGLNIQNLDNRLNDICNALNNKSYDEAIDKIDLYINDVSIPQHLENTSTTGLKTQIKLMETELSVLVNRKVEINKMITNFRLMHHSKLGMVVSEILHLRKEIAMCNFMKENPDKDVKENKEFKEAKKDYDSYKQSAKHTSKQAYRHINNERKKQLQSIFRKASKLCHPDVVNEEVRKQAEQLFAQLNDAYYRNDLQKLQELYKILQENKNIFALKWEAINEVDRLEAIVSKLSAEIYNIRTEIDETKNTEAYETIIAIEDWEAYFENIKQKLENDLSQLKKEYERIQEPAANG